MYEAFGLSFHSETSGKGLSSSCRGVTKFTLPYFSASLAAYADHIPISSTLIYRQT